MDNNTGLGRNGSKWILMLVMLGLLVFTASRTLHFLQMTFPKDQEYLAYLGLVSFDLGALAWLWYSSSAAEGVQQRVVAYGMIAVCVLGIAITTVADILTVSSANGIEVQMPKDIATVSLWSVCGVIILNVIAMFLVHLFDPKHVRHMAMEDGRAKILEQSYAAIKATSSEIAPIVARHVAEQWKRDTMIALMGYVPDSVGLSSPTVVDALPNAPVAVPSSAPVQQKSLPAMGYAPTSNKNLTSTPVTENLDSRASELEKKSLEALAQRLAQRPVGSIQTG